MQQYGEWQNLIINNGKSNILLRDGKNLKK